MDVIYRIHKIGLMANQAATEVPKELLLHDGPP